MNADTELQSMFLSCTKRLASVTAELGIAGDEPVEKLAAHAKQLMRDRSELFKAAVGVLISGQQSMGQVFVSPEAYAKLNDAVNTYRRNSETADSRGAWVL